MERPFKLRVEKEPCQQRKFDVVALGASAGGLNAISRVLGGLSKDFPGSVVVVQHLSPAHKSWMSSLLGRNSPLKVKQAEDGDVLRPGTVYTGPPDKHLLVQSGRIQLTDTVQIHFSRPSIDLLFESVARAYGSRCIGVVLSGSGKDGATGILAIKDAGGTTIAQKPETAEFRNMPEAAIDTGCIDFILPLDEIGEKLGGLCLPLQERGNG